MLVVVAPLGLLSALGPPFSIAVAIVKIGARGHPPDRERETGERCFVLYCWDALSKSNVKKRKEKWVGCKEGPLEGQLKGKSDQVGSGCRRVEVVEFCFGAKVNSFRVLSLSPTPT